MALANQGRLEQELNVLRDQIASKETELQEASDNVKKVAALEASLTEAVEDLEMLKMKSKAELEDAWLKETTTADVYRERAQQLESSNKLERELNEKIKDMQKQLESAEEKCGKGKFKKRSSSKSVIEADKISMELELDKFREEHDKFLQLNEELELAASARASGTRL